VECNKYYSYLLNVRCRKNVCRCIAKLLRISVYTVNCLEKEKWLVIYRTYHRDTFLHISAIAK